MLYKKSYVNLIIHTKQNLFLKIKNNNKSNKTELKNISFHDRG